MAIEQEINSRNATITQLDTDIISRTGTRDDLNNQITALTNSKNELEGSISQNKPVKDILDQELTGLNTQKSNINADIKRLEEEKAKLEDNVKQWREKNDLFSNDIAGISEDSLSQRTRYVVGITLSVIAAVSLICILICTVKGDVELPASIQKELSGNPRLVFAMIVLIRISIVGSLFVLIFVFTNLMRGFVSQYIRTQEKMMAVRLLDYLSSKIGKETNFAEPDRMTFETKKLEKQNELLNKHLPDLIEYNPSSFDKLSKTKSPEEIITDLANSGKINILSPNSKPD